MVRWVGSLMSKGKRRKGNMAVIGQAVYVRAVKIAAVAAIGVWCGVVLAGAGQPADTRCSLVWSSELGLVWVLEAPAPP